MTGPANKHKKHHKLAHHVQIWGDIAIHHNDRPYAVCSALNPKRIDCITCQSKLQVSWFFTKLWVLVINFLPLTGINKVPKFIVFDPLILVPCQQFCSVLITKHAFETWNYLEVPNRHRSSGIRGSH